MKKQYQYFVSCNYAGKHCNLDVWVTRQMDIELIRELETNTIPYLLFKSEALQTLVKPSKSNPVVISNFILLKTSRRKF